MPNGALANGRASFLKLGAAQHPPSPDTPAARVIAHLAQRPIRLAFLTPPTPLECERIGPKNPGTTILMICSYERGSGDSVFRRVS
jgi:hypothetical protein